MRKTGQEPSTDPLERDGWKLADKGAYEKHVGPFVLTHDRPNPSRRIDFYWSVERPWKYTSSTGYKDEGIAVIGGGGGLYTWQGARRAAERTLRRHLESEAAMLSELGANNEYAKKRTTDALKIIEREFIAGNPEMQRLMDEAQQELLIENLPQLADLEKLNIQVEEDPHGAVHRLWSGDD